MTRNWLIILVVAMVPAVTVLAGGGGQNTLLLVNPDDENSLRVAAAYAQLRDIPDRNVVFISMPEWQDRPQYGLSLPFFQTYYQQPLVQALTERGLTNQIDYIAQVGGPARMSSGVSGQGPMSFTHGLSVLTPLSQGATNTTAWSTDSALYQGTNQGYPQASLSYQIGENYAIHHSQTYDTALSPQTQYYMTGRAGFTGFLGTTPELAIAALERAVGSDGTKPQGTIYFESNSAVNTLTRSPQWPAVQQALTDRGIPWVEEFGTPGNTPLNRDDVRGVIAGAGTLTLPNGSTYLPGAWADSLQSYGAMFTTASQTKSTVEFLNAGAAGSSGTIAEPFAVAARFPDASIHLFVADGSTLGEAFAKSVKRPIMQMFMGDLLAQPYADVPQVEVVSGPEAGTTISGSAVAIDVSAAVPDNATLATGIKELRLYVDGKPAGSPIQADQGQFVVDTTELADGQHELRVVAYNNAAAESEGYALWHVTVDNHGRSVVAPEAVVVAAEGIAPVTTTAEGSATRIELRHMGRVVGQLSGAGGEVGLDVSKLAYGGNKIVPVAVYADGMEVAGKPIEVHRSTPDLIPGRSLTPQEHRTYGVQAEYFYGKGESTIAASDFSGSPDQVYLHDKLAIASVSGKSFINPVSPEFMPAEAASQLDKLAIRINGVFEVAPELEGEWRFFFYNTNDTAMLMVDGEEVISLALNHDGTTNADWGDSVFLGTGEHELTILASNLVTTLRPDYYDIALFMRGPDGVTRLIDSTILYQVPEPGSAACLLTVAVLMARRRPSRLILWKTP